MSLNLITIGPHTGFLQITQRWRFSIIPSAAQVQGLGHSIHFTRGHSKSKSVAIVVHCRTQFVSWYKIAAKCLPGSHSESTESRRLIARFVFWLSSVQKISHAKWYATIHLPSRTCPCAVAKSIEASLSPEEQNTEITVSRTLLSDKDPRRCTFLSTDYRS